MDFIDGELILCYHGPLLYEAKILKIFEFKDQERKFFVHYNGWNKSWDEWVTKERIMKLNPENMLLQKHLKDSTVKNSKLKKEKQANHLSKLQKLKTEERQLVSDQSNSDTNEKELESIIPLKSDSDTKEEEFTNKDVTPKIKFNKPFYKLSTKHMLNHRKHNLLFTKFKFKSKKPFNEELIPFDKPNLILNTVTNSEFYGHKFQKDILYAKIHIPELFHPILIDDWDHIYNQQKLLSLPSRYSIDMIFQLFLKNELSGGEIRHLILAEFLNNLKMYFNAVLGSQILYSFERPQYADILDANTKETPLSSIYGLPHLLRFFVNFFENLQDMELELTFIDLIIPFLESLFKFLVTHKDVYLKPSDYENALPDYYRKII